jgi:hypothetical protein
VPRPRRRERTPPGAGAVARAGRARPLGARFGANEPGAIAITLNTLMTCADTVAGCGNARDGLTSGRAANNNGCAMTRVDVDGDPATFDSSRARLSLHAGGDVLFAGLYWGADGSAGSRGQAAPQRGAAGVVRPGMPAIALSTPGNSTSSATAIRASLRSPMSCALRGAATTPSPTCGPPRP